MSLCRPIPLSCELVLANGSAYCIGEMKTVSVNRPKPENFLYRPNMLIRHLGSTKQQKHKKTTIRKTETRINIKSK